MLSARKRAGLTLIELLAVMAILAALGAVLYPAVAVQLRKGQTTALADQLKNLSAAIGNYRTNVQRFPATLTQLTQQPATGAPDLCGGTLPAANANAWRGPYITQSIIGNMPVGDATVQNLIVRVPPTNAGGPNGVLQIQVTGVDISSAADLDKQFDGDSVYTTGTIRWVAAGSSGNLSFVFPIRNC